MSTEVTLKRIGFKAGTAASPDPVAEIVLMCKDPYEVVHLTRYVTKSVLIDVAPIQQELPLDTVLAEADFEAHGTNGTGEISAGRRRRGTRSSETAEGTPIA